MENSNLYRSLRLELVLSGSLSIALQLTRIHKSRDELDDCRCLQIVDCAHSVLIQVDV